MSQLNNDAITPAPLIKQFESQAPRGKALEIGAGKGNNAIYLAQQGFSVTAVELNKESTQVIEKRAQENEVVLDIANQDIRDFAIEKNRYALISSFSSLNFLSREELIETINKIKAGLVMGGICAIVLYTNNDPMVERVRDRAIALEDGSFCDEAGKKWYYPKNNELRELFEKDFSILFYIEAVIEDKIGHPGNFEPHQHAVARLVAKK